MGRLSGGGVGAGEYFAEFSLLAERDARKTDALRVRNLPARVNCWVRSTQIVRSAHVGSAYVRLNVLRVSHVSRAPSPW